MIKEKIIGINPINNKILYGNRDITTGIWSENSQDITKDVLSCVFNWFYNKMKDSSNGEKEEYIITYPDSGYELVMRKKGKQ